MVHQKNSEKYHNNVLTQRKPSISGIWVVTASIIALVTVGRAEPVSRAGSWRGSPGGQPPPSQRGWRGGQPGDAGQQYPPAASGRSPGAHSGARVKLKTEERERNHPGSSQGAPRSQSCLRGVASARPGLQLPLGTGDAPCGHSKLGWPNRRESHLGLWFPVTQSPSWEDSKGSVALDTCPLGHQSFRISASAHSEKDYLAQGLGLISHFRKLFGDWEKQGTQHGPWR